MCEDGLHYVKLRRLQAVGRQMRGTYIRFLILGLDSAIISLYVNREILSLLQVN
jgi:hypothetical protein